MKVLHVVTLVSDDGAFGGPLRVALNQAEALRALGHDVTIAAAWRGSGAAPEVLHGTAARLFVAQQLLPVGLSGLRGRGMSTWLSRRIRDFDVVHVHAGRDLVTLGAMAIARRAGVPYVSQTHGMIGVDGRRSARVVDAVATRRLLRSARCRLVLTPHEAAELASVVPGAATRRLRNGVPSATAGAPPAGPPEVLYCARLHSRKRPLAFVAVADRLRQDFPDVIFSMVGPDEGELTAVRSEITARGLEDRVRYEGALPYDAVAGRLRRATVYVLPSVNEPFPMSLLEALSLGVASVITSSCGIADELQAREAALVTDGSVAEMAAVVGSLLDDPDKRSRLAERGLRAVQDLFSMEAVAQNLVEVYEAAILGPVR